MFTPVSRGNSRVISISYSSPLLKSTRRAFCHRLASQWARHVMRVCFGPLSLMQFNAMSFALDFQLPLPWWHAWKTHLAAACYCFITATFEVFFLSLSLFFLFVFLLFFFCFFFFFFFFLGSLLGSNNALAQSKDVLPCKQLPLQDKLLLYPLQGVLMPVHPNHRCECALKTSWWVNPSRVGH